MVPNPLTKVKLRRLTKVDVAWLHFKAALAFMLWSPMWQNPTIQQNLTGQFLIGWILVTALGFIFSVVGLILGAQTEDSRLKGLKVELIGLWLLMAGPLVFLAVMAGLWITSGEPRGLAVMFPYVVGAAVYARMVMVKSEMRVLRYRLPREVEAVLEQAVVRAEARASENADARTEARADADVAEAEAESKEDEKNA